MRTTNEIAPVERDATLPLRQVAGYLPGSKDGKGIGNLADDDTVTAWFQSYLAGRPDGGDAAELEVAYRFGARAESLYAGQSFVEVESELRSDWSAVKDRRTPWDRARDAAWAGFDRARDRRA